MAFLVAFFVIFSKVDRQEMGEEKGGEYAAKFTGPGRQPVTAM